MSFFRYWGKAGKPEDNPGHHPLAYHSLDVAACARVFLERDQLLRTRLEAAARRGGLRLQDGEIIGLVTFLVATHDLGKFSGRFQTLRPELARSLGLDLRTYRYSCRHDAMGAALWIDHVIPGLLADRSLVVHIANEELVESDCRDLLYPWISAVTGHHGLPPAPLSGDGSIDDHVARQQREDALAFVEELVELFGPIGLRFDEYPASLERALASSSWLLAGLAVAADWIGSNRTWFPYECSGRDLKTYWEEIALPRAAQAIVATGLVPCAVRPFPGFHELFDGIATPSPLQAIVSGLELATGPQLLLVEDQTGAGKTEAALTLASRLMTAGLADGVFFALPTMATANAMHRRVAQVYPRMFDGSPDDVSFILAHGESRSVLAMETAQRAKDYDPGEADISSELRDWISDTNKKALLAQVGVGTIDQALLCALRNKHSALRLVGLHRHVLLVDEVHACDAYVAKTLETLLEFQAMLGGSAILLSATLPVAMRRRFVRAFQRGLGLSPQPSGPESSEYPLLTCASHSGVRLVPCPARSELARRVPVRFLHDHQAATSYILAQANQGRCVVWVRNTVRDALASWEALQTHLGAERVDLFHARFLLGDRLRIEQDVVRRFGKLSTPAERAGRVLIATQVVEQSLDIDFDAMVTDLVPVDLVIQRLGRLHRHPRTGRPDPELVIFAPDWSDDPPASWVSSVLPGTSYVYDDPVMLWRTQQVLRQRGELNIPIDARHFVEFVYDADGVVPTGLLQRAIRADNTREANRGTAGFFENKPSRGYVHDGPCAAEDMGAPTRLGEATTKLRFGLVDGERLRPWIGTGIGAWSLSTCRVPKRQVVEPTNGSAAKSVIDSTDDMPDRGKGCVTFAVSQQNATAWIAEGKTSEGSSVTLVYDSQRGLEFRKARDGREGRP